MSLTYSLCLTDSCLTHRKSTSEETTLTLFSGWCKCSPHLNWTIFFSLLLLYHQSILRHIFICMFTLSINDRTILHLTFVLYSSAASIKLYEACQVHVPLHGRLALTQLAAAKLFTVSLTCSCFDPYLFNPRFNLGPERHPNISHVALDSQRSSFVTNIPSNHYYISTN